MQTDTRTTLTPINKCLHCCISGRNILLHIWIVINP